MTDLSSTVAAIGKYVNDGINRMDAAFSNGIMLPAAKKAAGEVTDGIDHLTSKLFDSSAQPEPEQ